MYGVREDRSAAGMGDAHQLLHYLRGGSNFGPAHGAVHWFCQSVINLLCCLGFGERLGPQRSRQVAVGLAAPPRVPHPSRHRVKMIAPFHGFFLSSRPALRQGTRDEMHRQLRGSQDFAPGSKPSTAPKRYGASMRFETTSSAPSLQAWLERQRALLGEMLVVPGLAGQSLRQVPQRHLGAKVGTSSTATVRFCGGPDCKNLRSNLSNE